MPVGFRVCEASCVAWIRDAGWRTCNELRRTVRDPHQQNAKLASGGEPFKDVTSPNRA
jgi:hypothetical protein